MIMALSFPRLTETVLQYKTYLDRNSVSNVVKI